MRFVALWNKKARLWLAGRKDIFKKLKAELRNQNSQLTWMHCSSLGEFEQGRPVLEGLKLKGKNHKILLTFFSPSGYEIRKDYKGADWVFYLPMDSKKNAKKFLDIINPSLVIFVKYDYWYFYITECKKRNIPLLMISAVFRKSQPFFKWYGSLHRKMLGCFTHFFVQDDDSLLLLEPVGLINKASVAGDTRFDRVAAIAENFEPAEAIVKFCGSSPVLVAGSTWTEDDKIIKEALADIPELKLIIAPHEIHPEHLQQVKTIFADSVFYSQLTTHNSQLTTHNSRLTTHNAQLTSHDSRLTTHSCLIIDNIGMLSRLYRYATITYVGGGFGKGIHNTLEAAVYGKPVFFGPNYKKFREASGLIRSAGGISVGSSEELSAAIKKLLADNSLLEQCSKSAFDFVQKNKGATGRILDYIEANRLLTS